MFFFEESAARNMSEKDKYQADTFSDSEVVLYIWSTLVQDRLIYAWNTEVFGYHYISFVF